MGRGLSAQSRQLIQQAYDVLAVEHPTGVRRVAYALFGNQAGQWVKKLGRLLTRARKDGDIPWAWINDSTRTEVLPFVVEDMAGIRSMNRACPSYDPWLQQPVRIKVWSEKSVSGTIDPVLSAFLVPFTVHHGNTSTDVFRKLAESTWDDPRLLIILYVGDHDAKGVRISDDDVPKRLKSFGARNVIVKRVALLRADAVALRNQRDPFKPKDTDVKWYQNHTGLDYGVELEALPSTVLRDRLERAIQNEIADGEAWHRVMNASRVVQESWEAYVDHWQPPAIRGLGSE